MGGGLLVGGYAGDGAMVIAHEAVLKTMSAPTGKTAPVPSSAWPTDAYPGESKEIYSNDEGLEVLHPGPANTDGDSIVYFRRSDVVVTGDVFSMTSYPVIDAEKGGSERYPDRILNFLPREDLRHQHSTCSRCENPGQQPAERSNGFGKRS